MTAAKRKRKLRFIVITIPSVLLLALLGSVIWLDTFIDPNHKTVKEAGIVEKKAQINDVCFNYAEGPNNGPALMLLNAQHLDWFSYNQVLPELSTKFHVYVVDYPGHGKTTYPDGYRMSANQIGSDLGEFMIQVIGEPAFVTGNSSGGLLTTWLAANRPELVKAVVLEDPPLFSAEYPRIKQTVAYKSFTTAYKCVVAGESDFLTFFLHDNQAFFEKYAGKLALPAVQFSVWNIRAVHPDGEMEIAFLSGSMRMIMRGFAMYDPHFGAAFYEGTWNEGFDHADALQKISCPALLIQANFGETAEGLLDGAMSADEAQRALSLLQKGSYVKVDAGHVTNLEAPDQFVKLVEEFFLEQ